MIVTDKIYGKFKVTDPLVIDLIKSKPVQRLKEISQDGATHFILPVFCGNRFEHSIGTWYLARKFDRPIEEQVACLLHDVPHTAFSHVVDFVMEDHNQQYHDKHLEEIVFSSEIPEICKKHGINARKIILKDNYLLLNNKTPELSFDRWDYFMRDAHMLGMLPIQAVRLFVSSAKLDDKQFYFEDQNIASQLCMTSLMVARLGYLSATAHGSYFLLANAIKIGIREKIITDKDLFTTDFEVLARLKASGNKDIDSLLSRLKPGEEFIYTTKEKAEFYGKNKARYIDPLVYKDGKFIKVSELIIGLKQYIEDFKEKSQLIGVKQLI